MTLINRVWVCCQVSFIVAQHEVIRNILQEAAVMELGCVVSPLCSSTFLIMIGNFYSAYVQGPGKVCVDTSCFLSAVYPAFHCNQIS